MNPTRRRLPDTRNAVTHKFDIQGHEGYVTVGLYPDGRPGELFITMAKEGSTIGGMMDVFGTAVSIGLQYGVPIDVLVEKFSHTRFEPSGFTKNPDIPIAKSIVDYIGRWMGMEFIPGYREEHAPKREVEPAPPAPLKLAVSRVVDAKTLTGRIEPSKPRIASDAPACDVCGSIMERSGTCYRCPTCGGTSGCS